MLTLMMQCNIQLGIFIQRDEHNIAQVIKSAKVRGENVYTYLFQHFLSYIYLSITYSMLKSK